MVERLHELRFAGRWRRYQQLALEAFERDRADGRRRTHIVAPPGSGKTLLGFEIVRRLGESALVLAPNSAVQAQWLAVAERFGAPSGLVGPDVTAPIACLTYQSLCRLNDPAVALGGIAERRWAEERAAATGASVAEVEGEAARWTGEAARRRRTELRRITAAIKREIARAEHGSLHLGRLLAPGARERVESLRANRVAVLVLDECHHLASMWGYVVRAVVEELGDVHLVGLTATPPGELTREEDRLYSSLLGPVDFMVPTPAVVRERHLAPFQELAWLTRPLDSETRWLAEHDSRFRELVHALHADAETAISFPVWVTTRMRLRHRGAEEAVLGWADFQRRHPALARAGARFLASAGLAPPEGAPRGEGYREPPNLEDWLVLLEDYALRCLRASAEPAAARRHEAVAAALRDLGFVLTRQGIRRGTSDVDRLLTGSAAKAVALAEVVACEHDARGERLRGLVLCDTELSEARPGDALLGVLRPDAGSAPEAVRALASDFRTAPLRPLLISGRGLRCAPHDAAALAHALGETQKDAAVAGTSAASEPDADGLARLVAPGLSPRVFVALATRAFAAGATQLLVGTRALLGEGWDAPCVNCVVDLTSATTSVSVTQMRGRSLRLDPGDPEKIASNWDIVCVAPELAQGDADYRRFVRKHLHLFAPTEDGAIEAGPSHVHPALSPFAPPADSEFAEVNRAMARRAAEHAAARERWALGEPYAGEEHETLVVRPRRGGTPAGAGPSPTAPAYPYDPRPPLAAAVGSFTGAGVLAAAGAATAGVACLAGLPLAAAWAAVRRVRLRREIHPVLPLGHAARAVCDAYVALGELRPAAAASLAIEPRASGYLRVWLRDASAEESARFARALDELIDPPPSARYVVSRLVPAPGLRVERRWESVPPDLGRHKTRAEAFARAWRIWLGPSELLFTQRSDDGRSALSAAAAEVSRWDAVRRRVWV